jgi:hypothetical protein
VLHTIVEGEPGIFPEPVARVMRAIGGLFGHRKAEPAPPAEPAPGGEPEPEDTTDEPREPDEPGQAGPAR